MNTTTWLSRRPEPVQMAIVVTLAALLSPVLAVLAVLAAPIALVWFVRQLDDGATTVEWAGRTWRLSSPVGTCMAIAFMAGGAGQALGRAVIARQNRVPVIVATLGTALLLAAGVIH